MTSESHAWFYAAFAMTALLSGCSASGGDEPGALSTGGSATSAAGQGPAGGATTASGGAASSSAGSGGQSQAGSLNAGGSAGSSPAGAGSGGTSGSAPVAACPGVGAVGTWEKISPPEFSSPPNLETTCIVVNPSDQSIYSAAGNVTNGAACPEGTTCPSGGTGIYKSTDCGATWNKISVTPEIETGSCFGLVADPVDLQTLYYVNGYGNNPTVWKSTDGGVNFAAIDTDASGVLQQNFVNMVALDPAAHEHLVVVYHENCAAPYAPQCLAESTDAGGSWRQFKGPEKDGWVEGASVSILGTTNFFYSSANGGWFTTDAGATWDLVVCWSGSGEGCTAVNGGIRPVHRGSDGAAYIGVLNTGILVSHADDAADPALPLGQVWSLIAGSPQANRIDDDGVSLFSSWEAADGKPFKTASLADPSVWTTMDSPDISRTSTSTAYDDAHHILYSANIGAGLWRLVTR